MTNRETMQQALKCIERLNMRGFILADYEDEVYAAITALREALAQDKLRGLENLMEESITALKAALEQPEQKTCGTCEALARTVMLDQTSHDTQRKPLTESMINAGLAELEAIRQTEFVGDYELIKRLLEAAHGIKE